MPTNQYLQISRKRAIGSGLWAGTWWALVTVEVSDELLPVPPVCESGLPVSQGLSWGFPLTIQREVNQENR